MASSNTQALSIRQMSYAYRTQWLYKSVPAISNLSLDLEAGEAFGFLGHNGAGKTTTIKCILDLVRPQKGEIFIFGRDCRLPEARASVGYVSEQPYFYDHLTVYELMDLYACLAGVGSAQRPGKIMRALERLNIADRRDKRMRTLSKGLTQRVAMAQAIVANPKLLVLDEPFSGLDPIGRKEFRDLVIDLKRNGSSIFMSSHVLSDVEYVCDRVSITVRGELKGIWNIKELRQASSENFEMIVRGLPGDDMTLAQLADSVRVETTYSRASFSSRASAEEALAYALKIGVQVDAFHATHENLEELFVRVVKEG